MTGAPFSQDLGTVVKAMNSISNSTDQGDCSSVTYLCAFIYHTSTFTHTLVN
jgi:hypothetical protein